MFTGLGQQSVNSEILTPVIVNTRAGPGAAWQALPACSYSAARSLSPTLTRTPLHTAAFLLVAIAATKKMLTAFCELLCLFGWVLCLVLFVSLGSTSAQPLCFLISGFRFTLPLKLGLLTLSSHSLQVAFATIGCLKCQVPCKLEPSISCMACETMTTYL